MRFVISRKKVIDLGYQKPVLDEGKKQAVKETNCSVGIDKMLTEEYDERR